MDTHHSLQPYIYAYIRIIFELEKHCIVDVLRNTQPPLPTIVALIRSI